MYKKLDLNDGLYYNDILVLLVDIRGDKVVIPWVKAAELLGVKVEDLMVNQIDYSEVTEEFRDYRETDDGKNRRKSIDRLHEAEVVFKDEYIEIKFDGTEVMYTSEDNDILIFKKV